MLRKFFVICHITLLLLLYFNRMLAAVIASIKINYTLISFIYQFVFHCVSITVLEVGPRTFVVSVALSVEHVEINDDIVRRLQTIQRSVGLCASVVY